MKKLTILLLLFSFIGLSQTNSVRGNLITKDQEPIAFANVLLALNGTLTKGTTSDENGLFEFTDIGNGSYTLTISYLGFESYTKNIVVNSDMVMEPITLVEETNSLEEVEVKVKRPVITQKQDRLIFRVDNTILSSKDTWNILNNTPGVFTDQERLLIKNNPADVYINNKKVQLPQEELQSFLEGLDGNTVKSIEVISNPSVKYDAQSSAIINIVLKESLKDSYKGNVSANYTIGEFDRYILGTSHFYKKNKIDITANYNFSEGEKIVKMRETINFFDTNNDPALNWLTNTDIITKNKKHNLLLNVDYAPNKDALVTLSTLHNFLVDERANNHTNGTIFNNLNEVDSTYVANNDAFKDNKYLSYALDYDQKLSDEGERIITSVNYSYFNTDHDQNVSTDYFLPDNTFIRENRFMVDTDQKINIYAAKIDYTLPLKENSRFESGVKVSKVKSESDFRQYDLINNALVIDDSKSNLFLYDELNYAIYGKYDIELEKVYYQLGLRTEYTDLKGNSITTTGNVLNEDDYIKLFPSILINYYPNDNHDFVISYKKSITRPMYHQLNPFRFFFSDFAANVGNPNLRPTLQHNIDFTYVLKRKYMFNAFYSNQEDRVSEIPFQENDTNLIKYINVNLSSYRSFGLLFTANNQITDYWSLFSQIFLVDRKNEFVGLESDNRVIGNSNFNYNLKFVNNFSFLKDKSLKANVTYQYVSEDIYGPTKQSHFSRLDVSLQKSFFKNKAVLSFGIEDIFENANSSYITRYENQDQNYFQRDDTNLIRIGFRYNFGNNKLKDNQRKKTVKEEERLNNN